MQYYKHILHTDKNTLLIYIHCDWDLMSYGIEYVDVME